MNSQLTVTARHKTYLRDTVILAVLGFVAGCAYFLIRVLFADPWLALVYILMASGWFAMLKQKFLPGQYQITKTDNGFEFWQRGDFDHENKPNEMELLSVEQTENGGRIICKNFGMSQIKTYFDVPAELFGPQALPVIRQFVENSEQFDLAQLKQNAHMSTRITGVNSKNALLVKLAFEPAKVSVTTSAYLLMLGVVAAGHWWLQQ